MGDKACFQSFIGELIYVRVLIICFKWERIRETNFVEDGEHMYADAQNEERIH